MAYTSVISVHRLDNAIDYTLDEKKCSRRENEESLEGEIDKALNKDKTEQDLFRSAIGCTVDSAFEDMCRVKEMWHKEKGVQGFHLVQSFAVGEVSPELAHQIGLEFADRLLGGHFQAVVSTHLNTKCVHNHIVWNSVSMKPAGNTAAMKSYVTQVRRISDELWKHHLSVSVQRNRNRLPAPTPSGWPSRTERPHGKRPSAGSQCGGFRFLTWKQFLRALEQKGYAFRFDLKYPTLILPGSGRTVRFKTLGKQYTPEAIQTASSIPASRRAGKEQPPANRFLLLLGETQPRRLSGLRALYFSYLYKMGALPKKPRYPSYAVREDIRRLDQRIEQAEFIFQNKIEDRGQLTTLRQKTEDEIAVLIKQRQKLYCYEPGSQQIGLLTEQLKKLRHTAKLCRNIETHSIEMEQCLQAAQQEEQRRREQREKEEQQKEARNRDNQKRR
ncbi:MAG: relaxase/mobilization nuclease domain-containing protein [[Clostridium] leptum]